MNYRSECATAPKKEWNRKPKQKKRWLSGERQENKEVQHLRCSVLQYRRHTESEVWLLRGFLRIHWRNTARKTDPTLPQVQIRGGEGERGGTMLVGGGGGWKGQRKADPNKERSATKRKS